jgi:dihydropteroate synthase
MLQTVATPTNSRRPVIMGVLNVTPDSFSDGGRFLDPAAALDHALRLREEGADIIDVGGESTRPGSRPVSEEEELARVIPVVRALAARSRLSISIDTTKPRVAREAVAAGAGMINDVSTLRNGDALARIAADTGVELVIMHSRKSPADMQRDPTYDDLLGEVAGELLAAAERARRAGVRAERIWLDPGIGFAKTAEQNAELLARTRELAGLGYPLLIGPSRKSFIGAFTGAAAGDRLGGTAAAVAAAVLGGARAVRVHDVAVMRQAAIVAHEIALGSKRAPGGGDA